jgi:hypothetical protein
MTHKDIPQPYVGKQLDYTRSKTFPTTLEAQQFFDQAQRKLLAVNDWHQITKGPSATFRLMDAHGDPLERHLSRGDLIQIDIPGPGLPSSQGYDWVRVEEIEEKRSLDEQSILLRLRPTTDPKNDLSDTAHFFKAMATSNFLIHLQGREVYFHYAGRNEVINTDNSSTLDNVRNFMVGVAAKLGASYPQWKALVDGFAEE